MLDYEQIKKALAVAKEEGHQTAMFHYITFHYAEDLIDENPKDFCRRVGMKDSYATEVRTMRAMHKLIKSGNAERFLKIATS